MSDQQSNGEFLPEPEPTIEQMEELGLHLIRIGLPSVSDAQLDRCLALYHEEWERRHDEKWVIAE